MTAQEFDKLSDREVDALIAEHVLSYQWLVNNPPDDVLWLTAPENVEKFKDPDYDFGYGYDFLDDKRAIYCPYYSTDKNEIRKLLNAMCKKTDPSIMESFGEDLASVLGLLVTECNYPWHLCSGVLAEAREICKAALLTLEVIAASGTGEEGK